MDESARSAAVATAQGDRAYPTDRLTESNDAEHRRAEPTFVDSRLDGVSNTSRLRLRVKVLKAIFSFVLQVLLDAAIGY